MLLIMDSGYDIIVHEDIPGDTNQIIDNTRPQYNSQIKISIGIKLMETKSNRKVVRGY